MKPLKEIGFRVTPNENSVTQFEPYTTFTDEERRELVRDSILAFLQNMNGDRRVMIPSIEDWIKEQGL